MLVLKIMATPVHTYLTPVFIYFAAPGLLVAECRIFDLCYSMWHLYSCSMRTLSCGMWDPVSRPGVEPEHPTLGAPES